MKTIDEKFKEDCKHKFVSAIRLEKQKQFKRIYLLGSCQVCNEKFEITDKYQKVSKSVNFYRLKIVN